MSPVTRAVVFLVALSGMTLSAVAVTADLLHRVGDGYRTKALQATGEARERLLASAQEASRRAWQIEPWQPAHAFRRGRAAEARAALFSPLSAEAQVEWQAAAEFYGQAVRRHPVNARFHAALAWASLQAGDLNGGRRAVRAALKLAPDYPDLRFTVARWYLIQWEALSAEERQVAETLVHRGARELPDVYVEAVWQLVRDPKTVRAILPDVPNVRRLLLKTLTERRLFTDRWAEQADHPDLRAPIPENGVHVLAQGQLAGRQEPPPESATSGPWTGMVAGWLSGGLTAKVDLDVAPGELVLYIPISGEPAGGIWPAINVTLGGHALPLPAIRGPLWRTAYVLVSTPGGRMPLQAVLTNSAVILDQGQFIERRATLGPVRVLTPPAFPRLSAPLLNSN